MITCKNCGYQMDDDALFCEQCGAPVSQPLGGSVQNGYQNQYQNGYQDGYQNGYPNDYQTDYQNGYPNSYQNNYQDGFQTPPPAPAARRSRVPLYIAIAAAIVVVIAAGAGLAVWFLADSPAENTQPDAVQYGTNLEEITFSAKDGSRLIFQAVRRTDSLSLDDMTDRICSSELERMSSSEVILNHVKDNYGKVIVTGWDNERDGYTDYCLTKIKQDTILRMTVQFPGYTNDDDELRMGYLTETFYRMCGFSDADPWRTYEEYIRENG